MRIDQVQYSNFRQHRDVTLDLHGDSGYFVVIKGNNGAGKTTFLNGITWCLYELIDEQSDFERESLLSQSAILSAEEGQEVSVTVAIDLSLRHGGAAKISRQYSFVKSGEEVKIVNKSFEVMAMAQQGVGFQRVSEPSEWVDENLPRRFSPYFLFDGERLDRFFRSSDARFIRDSVLQIANIDVLERMNVRLQSVSGDLLRSAAKGAGAKGEELAQENKTISDAIELESSNLETKLNEVQRLTDSIQHLSNKIGNVAEIAADFERRKDLAQSLVTAQNRLDVAEAELTQWAVRAAPGAMALRAYQTLGETIDKARHDRVLPPPFSPEAVAELLEKGVCLCNRDLTEGSDACRHVREILSKFQEVSNAGSILSGFEPHLISVHSEIGQSRQIADAILDRIKISKTEIGSLKKKLDGLEARLAGHSDEEIAALHQSLRNAEEAKDIGQRAIGHLEAKVESLQNELAKNAREIAAQSDLSEKSAKALKDARFSEAALKASQEVYQILCDGVRTEVAATLDSQFKDMLWKKNFIDKVTIDAEFKVSVIQNQGFEILEKLSAGERTCLAFAFSLSLSNVAGLTFPMVVDSPLGRLGPEVQENLAGVLAMKTKGGSEDEIQQVILLMTDTEYTQGVSEILAIRSPRVFRIDVDVANSETSLTKELG